MTLVAEKGIDSLDSRLFDVIGSISQSSLQIWSTAAGYGELCVWF